MKKFKLRAAAALATAFALFTSVMPASFAEYDPDVIPVYEEADDSAGELSVAAAVPETSKFSYRIENGTLTVSLNDAVINNSTGKDVEAIIAVYDGDDLLRTKIYRISGDYKKVTVNDWQTEVPDTGDISVRAFMWAADGSCAPVEESAELSNVPSNAYKVYGRVMSSPNGSADGLRPDEVRFNVERSDNFDGEVFSRRYGTCEYIFKTGSTNARDMLFIYSEAYVVKDEETCEFTIMSIKPVGEPKTVTFAAKDVADDDPTIYLDYIGRGRIPVYKSESTSSTIKYDLSKDEYGDANAIMYVNGVEVGYATNEDIVAFTGDNNRTGTVTLIDRTEEGSTASDGKYDYIMVDYYADAVVDYVTTTSGKAKVYFKASQTSAYKMEWDTEDQDVDITFTKDGKQIAYTELAEYDILSIKYNVVAEGKGSYSLTDKDYYNVLVSTNKVTGSVTSRDTDDNTVTIGGNKCELAMNSAYEFELGTVYDVYIDAFGYIAYYDEGSPDKNYGVIVGMYQESGRDYPTVRLVTANGEIADYECKDQVEANLFYNYATGTETGYKNGGFNKTDAIVNERIKYGETVCTYKLSGGKIKFDRAFDGVGGYDLTYKASTAKLGTYSISDAATRIIDMDEYVDGYSDKARAISISSFKNGAEYDAYFFDKNNDSVYRFAIVFGGELEIEPETETVEEGMGIIVAMYTKSGDDYPTVRLVTTNGEIADYECKDSTEADTFYNYATGTNSGYQGYGFKRTSAIVNERIKAGETVCTYRLVNGKIVFDRACEPAGSIAATYYASSAKLDGYSLSVKTVIIDLDEYLNDYGSNVYTTDITGLHDGGMYTAYMFNRSAGGSYGIAVIYDGEADHEEAPATVEDGMGVIVAMYTKSGDDYPTVRLVTANGEIADYECNDQTEADTFYNYATGTNSGYQGYGFKRTSAIVNERIKAGETVCAYRLVNGRLMFDRAFEGQGGRNLEFKAGTSELGEYRISDEATRIIDMDEYMSETNSSNKVRALSTNNFEDEAEYAAYLFDRNNDGVYRFAIVFRGTSSIRPESRLAVVKATNGAKDVDSNTCNVYTVARDGQDIELLVDDINGLPVLHEGDVVAYTLNSDGYVESGNLYVLFDMESNDREYASLLNATLANDEFKNMLNGAVVSDNVDEKSLRSKAANKGARAIAFDGTVNENKEVYAYFGIVYKKGASNVEIFTKQDENGVADVNSVADFSLRGANIYTYDFAERKAKGVRLSVGNSGTQNTSIFNPAYVRGSDKNLVDFDTVLSEDIRPQLALIKEVDGDVTDAVFFVAP